MSGPVALLGADEFLPAVAALDAELLAATGRARPRVTRNWRAGACRAGGPCWDSMKGVR